MFQSMFTPDIVTPTAKNCLKQVGKHAAAAQVVCLCSPWSHACLHKNETTHSSHYSSNVTMSVQKVQKNRIVGGQVGGWFAECLQKTECPQHRRVVQPRFACCLSSFHGHAIHAHTNNTQTWQAGVQRRPSMGNNGVVQVAGTGTKKPRLRVSVYLFTNEPSPIHLGTCNGDRMFCPPCRSPHPPVCPSLRRKSVCLSVWEGMGGVGRNWAGIISRSVPACVPPPHRTESVPTGNGMLVGWGR